MCVLIRHCLGHPGTEGDKRKAGPASQCPQSSSAWHCVSNPTPSPCCWLGPLTSFLPRLHFCLWLGFCLKGNECPEQPGLSSGSLIWESSGLLFSSHPSTWLSPSPCGQLTSPCSGSCLVLPSSTNSSLVHQVLLVAISTCLDRTGELSHPGCLGYDQEDLYSISPSSPLSEMAHS